MNLETKLKFRFEPWTSHTQNKSGSHLTAGTGYCLCAGCKWNIRQEVITGYTKVRVCLGDWVVASCRSSAVVMQGFAAVA
jgi:hypothetical protein